MLYCPISSTNENDNLPVSLPFCQFQVIIVASAIDFGLAGGGIPWMALVHISGDIRSIRIAQ